MNLQEMIKQYINKIFTKIYSKKSSQNLLSDIDFISQEVIDKVQDFTMTTPERLFSLINATRYIIKSEISGDFVECGVWKGGSMMAAAYTLGQMKIVDRQLYLFDTFEGMSEPTDKDVAISGDPASILLKKSEKSVQSSIWCYASLEEVQRNLSITQYPVENFHFIKGKVEDTIPSCIPEKIALLRLDTDWYESTRHELEHLFPRLVRGGVLIIDDYGHWEGCRKATDEYFRNNNISILLNRVDYTGRIGIKM